MRKTPESSGGDTVALTAALLTACVAFQLNASMLRPMRVTMGEELDTDQAAIGQSQTWFFTTAALFSLLLPPTRCWVGFWPDIMLNGLGSGLEIRMSNR